MSTLILTRSDVQSLLDIASVMNAVEQAFRDFALCRAVMPVKTYLAVDNGDFRAMPATLPGAVGVKWVNVHPRNAAQGLPTVMATLIYNDPLTGYPLAVMEASDLTAYRTGATAAIAAKYLARKDSSTLGIVGAGRQAYTQLTAHARLFKFKEIRVFDLNAPAADRFVSSLPGYPLRACSLEETVAADIVCTATPAREPFVRKEWVHPGTHINAIGADAAGKEELEPSILKAAMLVVDDLRQATAAGEINVPFRKGLIGIGDIHATLGEIIIGSKPGRNDGESVTVFDSTGLAIEDIAVAKLVYDAARERGGYLSVKFTDE